MRPSFFEIRAQIDEYIKNVKELESLAYGIQEVQHANTTYTFVCFYDKAKREMGVTLLDHMHNEIRLTSELPIEIFVAFGAFAHAVLEWQDGKGEFPAQNIDEQHANFIANARQILQRLRHVPKPTEQPVVDDFKLEP